MVDKTMVDRTIRHDQPAGKLGNSAPERSGRNLPLWLIAGLLAFIAAMLVTDQNGRIDLTDRAVAQIGSSAGAGGIMAFTGQLNRDQYGLVMVDVDAGTVWIYEYIRAGGRGAGRLKLVAARSWIYDRYLEDYNCAPLRPAEVAKLVAQQRNTLQVPSTEGFESKIPKPQQVP